ncbi:MAG: SH3 domain-containing protein [Anaerolineae bacterium]|nr:SH3 domain-containing protein [Anaerolineae bacterium]
MRRTLFLILAMLAAAAPITPVTAQDGGESCQAIYQAAVSAVMDNCVGMATGSVCWASGDVIIQASAAASGPGSTAPLDQTTAIAATASDSAWSMARLHVADGVSDDAFATLLVIGPASLTFNPSANLPPGADFTLVAEPEPSPCAELAKPGVVVQAPEKYLTLLRVNGVNLAINGTAVLHSPDGETLTVSAITHETILSDSGTVVFAGYSATAMPLVEVPAVVPFDPAAVAFLPTEVLPRMEYVPLPGSAYVVQQTVLHLRPDASAYTGTTVKAGVPASVLARDSSGDWLYIRRYEGGIGWVPREALDVDVPVEMPVIERDLPPLVRPFGAVQARGATTAEHNNLRDGPGQQYEIVATVGLGTELNIYARGPLDEWLLVETPDGVRAWISIMLLDPLTPFNLAEMPYSPDYPG